MEKLSKEQLKILDYISKSEKSVTQKELKKALNIETEINLKQFKDDLNYLRFNGYIYLNNNTGKYILFKKCQGFILGTIKYKPKSEANAYIVNGNHHLLIDNNGLNGAIPGDLVIVKRDSIDPSKIMVHEILKRENGLMLFDYDKLNNEFTTCNWPEKIHVNIPLTKDLINGTRVQVKLELDKVNNAYNGQIVSIIGHKDDPDFDVKNIVCSHGIIIDFSKEAIVQAQKIKQFVSAEEIDQRCQNGGLDLRNETIFTIDGENTKDIDDAVSIKKLPNKHYKLKVHIADVSYYINEGTALDIDASQRSTSVYPYKSVIPMLPHYLSNGICSLNPNEDRLTLSCIIEIDEHGEIINYEFKDTIINSKKKMSYNKINDILERQIIHEDYKPFIHDLMLMAELSEILNKKKNERGYVCFGDNEVVFKEENNIITDIQKRTRGTAQRMIENFMLTANECAASFTYWQQSPGIYRIHPEPNIDKLKATIELFGLKITIPNNIDDPRVLQNIIEKIKRYDSSGVYNELLLQAMNRASYSPDNIGHFGLALQNYTHFTSPIRRYPDLQTHRIIRDTRDLTLEDEIESYKKLVSICEHASKQERLADKAERDVDHYKMAEYMENHIGETFMGFVTYISHNGVSVKTDDFIFGKISFESLKQLGYEYDSEKFKLVNRATGTELFLGDRIEIVVKSANKETYKIEFELKQKIPKQKIKVS